MTSSIIRSVINSSIKERGTQGVVAEESGIDGAALSKFLSGEGALKLEALEKIVRMSNCRIMPDEHYQDMCGTIRSLTRLWMDATGVAHKL